MTPKVTPLGIVMLIILLPIWLPTVLTCILVKTITVFWSATWNSRLMQ